MTSLSLEKTREDATGEGFVLVAPLAHLAGCGHALGGTDQQ